MGDIFSQKDALGLRSALLLILCIGLMVADIHQFPTLTQTRSLTGWFLTPIHYAVHWPSEILEWTRTSFKKQQALIEENANLKAQQLMLKGKLQRFLALQKENSQLRALLGTTERSNERFVVARILSVDPDSFIHHVVLNRGTKQNIYRGQPVLDDSGIIGQVTEVGPSTSRVLLISDFRSAVPVQVARNGLRSLVAGVGNTSRLKLLHLPGSADVKVGDLLTTSGLGRRFPQGYPVGVVSFIQKHKGDRFMEVDVTPSAHLDRSRLVLLVWPS